MAEATEVQKSRRDDLSKKERTREASETTQSTSSLSSKEFFKGVMKFKGFQLALLKKWNRLKYKICYTTCSKENSVFVNLLFHIFISMHWLDCNVKYVLTMGNWQKVLRMTAWE